MFRRLATTCGALVLALVISAAQAQSGYPDRVITLVVPYPAGGTADLLCRFAADKAGSNLGQQVVVENRPGGAGGRVGTESVLRAAPDGYTLLCAAQLTFSVTHLLFSKASFDTRALEPISVLAAYPLILIGRGSLPFDNLPDLIAYARANPGKINYGHQGKGQTGHLLGELLMLKGKFRMTEIPYRGSQQTEHRCRQAQIARNRQSRAAQGLSARRHDPGDVAGRFRGYLDGGGSAPGHTQGDHRASIAGARAGIPRPKVARAYPRAGSRPARGHAGRHARFDPAKFQNVGSGDRGRQDRR